MELYREACFLLGDLARATFAAKDVPDPILQQRFVLADGLTLMVHEDRKAPIFAVNVW